MSPLIMTNINILDHQRTVKKSLDLMQTPLQVRKSLESSVYVCTLPVNNKSNILFVAVSLPVAICKFKNVLWVLQNL